MKKSALEIARQYLRRGWCPISVHPRSKKPTITGWQIAKVNETSLETYFNKPELNIGVRLGEDSGGLVDVDIDDEDARLLAPHFLLDTMTFGRASNRRSHYLFICDPVPKTSKFADTDRSVLLEIRGNGCQTVFPGSVHQSGEKIQWEAPSSKSAPLSISPSELARAVRKLAAAAFLVKRWHGVRDDIATALCGALLRMGWPPAEVDAFVEIVAKHANDEERSQRLKAGHLSRALNASRGSVPGWPRLQELIGKDDAERLKSWLTHDLTAMSEQDVDAVVDELNSKHAVVTWGGRVLILTEVVDPQTGWTNIALCAPADLRTLYANRKISAGRLKLNAATVWLEHPRRREYEGIVFAPQQSISTHYNLWRGFSVEAEEGDCELYLAHIRENICSKDEGLYDYVIAWMADAVQNPRHRPGVSLVLRGSQGTGKGVFASTFGKLFGQHFVHVTSARHLLGNFNAHLKSALIVFADEAFWAGDHAAAGVIKGMVTEQKLAVEYKGKDVIFVENHIRLIMASNSDWVVPAGLEERRFCVIDVSDSRIQQNAYFGTIVEQMKNGGSQALLHFLLNYKLEGVDLRKFPKTRALLENQIRSMTQVQRFWYECLVNGAQRRDHDRWDDFMACAQMLNEFQEWSSPTRRGYQPDSVSFGMELKKLVPVKRTRRTISGVRVWVYEFPSLEKCRKAFERRIRGIAWPDESASTSEPTDM